MKSAVSLGCGSYQQCEIPDASDDYARACRNRNTTVILYGPDSPPVLALTTCAGRQRNPERGQTSHRSGSHRWRLGVEPLINSAAKSDHRDNREHRKYCPLCPGGGRGDCGSNPDHNRRNADEHQVKLRAHEAEFCSEEYRACNHPAPPRHSGTPAWPNGRAPPRCMQSISEGVVCRLITVSDGIYKSVTCRACKSVVPRAITTSARLSSGPLRKMESRLIDLL